MSSRMAIDVLVRLRDRMSGPLGRLSNRLSGLSRAARVISLIGGLAAGISFMGPMNEAASFDQTLRDTAVTANLATEAVAQFIETATGNYQDLAIQTGQASQNIASAVGSLKAAGMEQALIDQLIPSISKAATASSSDIQDIGKVAFALADTLDIPASRMEDALGQLVIAGKEGRFELNEMAKYFPTLTSQMAKLGIKGEAAVAVLASGLQIAMKGASDPAQAANNFKNFLSKIQAPDTIKRFADAGVNLTAVMQDAISKGINPIEAVLAKTIDLTGVGGKEISKYMEQAQKMGLKGADALDHVREQLEKVGGAEKLSALFGDQQVLDFLIPMIANIEEYKRIRDAVSQGDRSIIDQDFATQAEGATFQLKLLKEISTQSGREIGASFNEWLPLVNENLLKLRGYLQDLETKFPSLTGKVVSFVFGAILLATALGLIGVAAPAVATGFGLIAAAAMAMAGPVGLAVLALSAMAGLAMFQNTEAYAAYEAKANALGKSIRASVIENAAAYDAWALSVGKSIRTLVDEGLGKLKELVAFDLSIDWSALTDGFWDVINPVLEKLRQLKEAISLVSNMSINGIKSLFGDEETVSKPIIANNDNAMPKIKVPGTANQSTSKGGRPGAPDVMRFETSVESEVSVKTVHDIRAHFKVDGPAKLLSQSVSKADEQVNTGRAVGSP